MTTLSSLCSEANRRTADCSIVRSSRRALATTAARAAAGVSALSLLLTAGCSNPPLFEDTPKAEVRQERLRKIEAINLDSYRRPAPTTAPITGSAEQTAAIRKRFENVEKLDLTLESSRASALEHNLQLKIALLDPTIVAQSVSEEEARFESTFVTRARWAEFDTPTASELASAQSQNLSLAPGVRIPLRTGGTAEINLPINRNKDNNRFSTLNPAHSTDVEFSISQPLLRGAGRRASTAGIRIAKYNLQSAEAQTKLEVIRQLAAVDRSYWRLYQSRRELEVRQQQFELAEDQLRRAERRLATGAVPEIEVIRAQAGLSDRLEAIIRAQNAVWQIQRELKRIINEPGLTIDTNVLVIPATQPDPVEYVVDRAAMANSAVANRMEMLDLELRLAADAALISLNKNRALPLLTLDYTYRINGLGGTLDESASMTLRNKFEDWAVGLTAEVPLGNEAARSAVRRAILQRVQRLSTKDAREQSIRQEVLNAIDNIEADWQRLLAARQSVILNTRTLQAEQRQFDVGQSTSTDVLDAAARLAEAQSAEIRAITDYQISQVDLAFATGTLLGAAKVDWSPAPDVDPDQPAPPETLPAWLMKEDQAATETNSTPDTAPADSSAAAPSPAAPPTPQPTNQPEMPPLPPDPPREPGQ
jgi:outer membrane protein